MFEYNVTVVPGGKGALAVEHPAPQLIPAGEEVTVPLLTPVPVLVMVSI